MIRLIDTFCLLIPATTAAMLVWRYRWGGIVAGTLVAWLGLLIGMMFTPRREPYPGPLLPDGSWLSYGWMMCLSGCVAVYGLRVLMDKLARRSRD